MRRSAANLALIAWMRDYRVTNVELALGAGVSTKTVSRWRSAHADPKGAAAEALVRFCGEHGDWEDANVVAMALGVAPLPDPSPPVAVEVPVAGPVVPTVDPLTPDHLGVALFLAAEQFRLPARELRIAVQRMVAEWCDRSCTLDDVQRAFAGLERLASASPVVTMTAPDDVR